MIRKPIVLCLSMDLMTQYTEFKFLKQIRSH
jgi:hypothetical protein